jgi:AraC-like DNA-binding protein
MENIGFSHDINVGYQFTKDVPSNHNASHTEHVISFIDQGHMRIEQGQAINISPGMLVLVPAGVPHSQFSGQNVGAWWVSFCTSCLSLDESHSLMAPFAQVRLGALAVFALPSDKQSYLVSLLQALQKERQLNGRDSPQVMKCLLMLILNEVKQARNIPLTAPANKDTRVAKALEFIQKNSLKAISLKDVANHLHLSPAYVATTVKKNTGYAIGEWINRSRLTHACSRLLHTDEKIDLIANQVGWKDVTHFIRMFKKAYGQTPAAWRKHNKG